MVSRIFLFTLVLIATSNVISAANVGAKAQFYAPPSGSLEEIAAQESYFWRTSKIIIGVQQSYTWTQYAQIEALKSMKSGLLKKAQEQSQASAEASMVHPFSGSLGLIDDRRHSDDLDEDDYVDDLSLIEKDVKVKEIPAVPRNLQLEEFMTTNGDQISQALHLSDVSQDKLEDASNQAKIGALKYMQMQLFIGSGDVQKSYWTAKLTGAVAPPELAFYQIVKSFLSTVALSVLFQIHDSFTLESYLDNFNDNFNTESQQDDFAEATAEYQVYSSWTALTGIKMALLYIDYAEANTALSAFAGAVPAQPQSAPMQYAPVQEGSVPVAEEEAGSFGVPPEPAAGAEPVREELAQKDEAQKLLDEALESASDDDAVASAASFLELKMESEAQANVDSKVGSGAQFYQATDPAAAVQQLISVQYYLSLLKYYNLMAEMQLANTGSTVASLKLISLRILTNGERGDDGSGYKLAKHAQMLEGVWLPQMYGQWAQISLLTYMMDAYLMYSESQIGFMMHATAAHLAHGNNFMAQMRSAEELNTVEGFNF